MPRNKATQVFTQDCLFILPIDMLSVKQMCLYPSSMKMPTTKVKGVRSRLK